MSLESSHRGREDKDRVSLFHSARELLEGVTASPASVRQPEQPASSKRVKTFS